MLLGRPGGVAVVGVTRSVGIGGLTWGALLALWVPRISSTSCDQAIFVDHATDASVSSDAVSLKIDWFG